MRGSLRPYLGLDPLKWTPLFGPVAKVVYGTCSPRERSRSDEEDKKKAQRGVQGQGRPGGSARAGDGGGDRAQIQGPRQHGPQVEAPALGQPYPGLRRRGRLQRRYVGARVRAAEEDRRADGRTGFFIQRARSIPMKER